MLDSSIIAAELNCGSEPSSSFDRLRMRSTILIYNDIPHAELVEA
jgi:hypothetical protein